jgi:hypothetical protein
MTTKSPYRKSHWTRRKFIKYGCRLKVWRNVKDILDLKIHALQSVIANKSTDHSTENDQV